MLDGGRERTSVMHMHAGEWLAAIVFCVSIFVATVGPMDLEVMKFTGRFFIFLGWLWGYLE